MPRYHFHLRNDIDVPDPEGSELPSLEAAREHALNDARFTLSRIAMDEGIINFAHSIDIEDEQGRILDTVWFRDSVEVVG